MKKWLCLPLVLALPFALLGCPGDDDGGAGPDLVALRIDFSIVSKTGPFAGRVRITGVVKNSGGDFISGVGQQSLFLYEVPLGGSPPASPTVVKAFQNVPSGGEVSVTYERNWNASSPSEGEFPPDYKLMIAYDPDIYLDANEQNDDTNLGNNTKTRSGSGINALF